MTDVKTAAHERKLYLKYLKRLTHAVDIALRAMDAEMQKPSDSERGKRIAAICNTLEMSNDSARYFALGIDYRTDRKVSGDCPSPGPSGQNLPTDLPAGHGAPPVFSEGT